MKRRRVLADNGIASSLRLTAAASEYNNHAIAIPRRRSQADDGILKINYALNPPVAA